MINRLSVRCVLRRLCGLGRMEVVWVIARAVLGFHGLRSRHISNLLELPVRIDVQLPLHGGPICAIFSLRSLQT